MGNSNSTSASVYNESHREISGYPPRPEGSVYSYSTVTSFRTNRTNMSTLGRKKKQSRVLVEQKARFLGRYYMRRIGEATLNKVQQHTKSIKGVKSKLKLSVDGLHTGYKQSSFVRTQVPASFVPLMKIHRLEIDPKYNNVLYCAQRTSDDNFEVFTYRLRSGRDAEELKKKFKDLYTTLAGREMTFGVRDIMLGSPERGAYDDSDAESNWTLRNDNTTTRRRAPLTSSKSTDNIYGDYNGGTKIYSTNTTLNSGTLTRANQGHRKGSEIERELHELSRDVRQIKQIVTHQQSLDASGDAGGVGVGRSTSAASNYPASVATNDSGYPGELVSAGQGVVRAQGGNHYQQKLHKNMQGKWKSETALAHSSQNGSVSTNTMGTTYRAANAVAMNGGPNYHLNDDSISRSTYAGGTSYSTSIPPSRENSFYGHQGINRYQSATLGNSRRAPSESSTVIHGGFSGGHHTVVNGSAYGTMQHQTSTLGRPNFALVYPHTPTSIRRQRSVSQSHY